MSVPQGYHPTPYGMDQFFDIVLEVIMPGGRIHFYTFKKQHQIESLIIDYEHHKFKVLNCCRYDNVAPGVSRWVLDMIKKIKQKMKPDEKHRK